MFNRSRFVVIILLIEVNALQTLVEASARRFPLGFGGMLCLIPCLLREWDLRNGLPPRRLGRLEWSYLLAGVLWVTTVYPLFIL